MKHGAAPADGALHLTLAAREDDGWVTLEFADDGRCAGNGAPGLGVGLENLEQRVRRFAGTGAHVEAGRQQPDGFVVTLRWRKGGGARHDAAGGGGGGGRRKNRRGGRFRAATHRAARTWGRGGASRRGRGWGGPGAAGWRPRRWRATR